jgi:hypothetical protein
MTPGTSGTTPPLPLWMNGAGSRSIVHRLGMDLSGVARPVVVPVRTDPEGKTGPTPDAARGSRWRRSGRGLYVRADVDPSTVDQRVVEAAAVLPMDWGGVTGWAALGWAGATWFDGTPWGGGRTRPVTLAIGGNRAIRPQPGIATSEERLAPGDLVMVDGLRTTSAVRSVCFEMRYARDVRDAVISLDMACFNDQVSIDEVVTYGLGLNGWTGMPMFREACGLANENAWSPTEVDMRLVWGLDAGCPWPSCNLPVFGPSGELLGVPDLIDPVRGVYGEYDGSLHLLGAQRGKDVAREAKFRAHGLEGATMLSGDRHDASGFISRLHEAYERSAAQPESRRRWTLEQPSWWRDTSTVAVRRALDDYWRARLLAHRVA